MFAFWRHGYRGTSLDDLTDAMAINRPSLYSAFGDKEALFIEAVDYYRDHFILPPVRRLAEAHYLEAGLRRFFQDIAAVVLDNDTPPGCFIACLLTEECCQSDNIKAKLSGLIASADAAFAKVFAAHAGQLHPGLSAPAAGKLLTATVHGLSIRARAGATNADLTLLGDAFIKAILP